MLTLSKDARNTVVSAYDRVGINLKLNIRKLPVGAGAYQASIARCTYIVVLTVLLLNRVFGSCLGKKLSQGRSCLGKLS